MVCLPLLLAKRVYAAQGEIFQAALVAYSPTFHQNQMEVGSNVQFFLVQHQTNIATELALIIRIVGSTKSLSTSSSIFTSLMLVSTDFLSLWKLCIRRGQRVLNWKDWILVFVYQKKCLLYQIYSLHVEKTWHSSRKTNWFHIFFVWKLSYNSIFSVVVSGSASQPLSFIPSTPGVIFLGVG